MRSSFVFAFLMVFAAAVSADQLYKWVDGQGKVHYSQTPPPGASTKAKVDIHVTPPDPANQAQAAQQAADTQDLQAALQKRCNALRAQLSAYSHSDDKTAKAAHQKEMDDLRAQIAKDCN